MNLGENYVKFIEARFKIIDKNGQIVPFILNPVQRRFMVEDSTQRNIVLKARQQGFSSLILARFAVDFITKQNINCVVVADISDNAIALLERVKFFIKSCEEKTGVKIPLKYNSKYELYNPVSNCRYSIGTAENSEFGRSQTITNLHMSEAAFYKDMKKLMSGALQAVVPDGLVVIETTANGFNELKEFWDDSMMGQTNFTPLFYPASAFYDEEFLKLKKQELGRMYEQEYPNSAEEAFLTSGSVYFDIHSLRNYLKDCREPISEGLIYE